MARDIWAWKGFSLTGLGSLVGWFNPGAATIVPPPQSEARPPLFISYRN
jgi:hypothetical protein